jgi:23S rRNA (adenine2030-N6)-methyltransferase
MLSYRHAFHAGNFADVLKHVVLLEVLRYLGEKEKPFEYFDTHAGAGAYSLMSEQAGKNREYEQGIGLLYAKTHPELQPYLDLVRRFNDNGPLRRYPGSPKIAEALLRPQDRGWLFELHPADFPTLQSAFRDSKHFRLAQEDGFEGVMRLLPPTARRGCILIDPSYEVKEDYTRVIKGLVSAHQRFASGIYCLWYPLVDRQRNARMERALINSGLRDIQCFELSRDEGEETQGMQAAGIYVINPPWTLLARMQTLLPLLCKKLGGVHHYRFRCETLVGE